LILRW